MPLKMMETPLGMMSPLALMEPLINNAPPKLLFESVAMGLPKSLQGPAGSLMDMVANAAPMNLLLPMGSPRRAIYPGDRVTSLKHIIPYASEFGGFVLFILGKKALVMWDGGILTVDDFKDLEKVR